MIGELYGVTFTPAALLGFETMLAEKSVPIVEDIRKKLASSDGAVHADETYWTTNGVRSYFWVHGDEKFIHFQYDTIRADQVSRDILGNDFTDTLVTDCYSGYFASLGEVDDSGRNIATSRQAYARYLLRTLHTPS